MLKSRVEGSEVISSCTVRQRTLDSQQSVKAVDGGHSCGIWAPWSIIKSSYNLGHHLKSNSQGIRVWKSSVNAWSVRNPKSQLLANCPFNQWLDDWNWFVRVHSCPNSHHISCQTPPSIRLQRTVSSSVRGPECCTYSPIHQKRYFLELLWTEMRD